MKRSIIVACAALVSLTAPARAGVLAPTKASQVLVLRQSGSNAICLPKGGGFEVDVAMRHDGTNAPFVQPSDQVVVVTGIDWGTTGGTAGQNAQVVLRLAGSSPVPA